MRRTFAVKPEQPRADMALVVRPIVGRAAVPRAPVCILARPPGRKCHSAAHSLEGDLAVHWQSTELSILATGKQLDIAMLPMDSALPRSHTSASFASQGRTLAAAGSLSTRAPVAWSCVT
jgi:hypothetical protein